MNQSDASTRDRLVAASAELFRQRGYHGVGLTEILKAAKAPKGSMYHHFPNGKPDLALAAADWASNGMLLMIANAFEPAPNYAEGLTTLCYRLAKFFDVSGGWSGCPVSNVLFDGPGNDTFRDRTNDIYSKWTRAVAYHAIRFGEDEEQNAETFLLALQGSWIMSRARGSADIIRKLPKRILPQN
jgi:TetR/AcrR family transcriptional regulator, lmrAB and yxaGH operons repressor